MAVRAYNTITLIRVDDAVWEIIDGYWHKNGVNQEIKAQGEDGLDGLSAYEVAVIGGYTGTETEFYNELASMEDTRQRVDDNTNQITSLGMTITERTTVGGEPVAEVVMELMAGELIIRDSIRNGGHNILKNPRFGGTELPDAGHWYSGGTVAGYIDWYGYLTVDEFLSLYGYMTVDGFLTTSLMGAMG